MTETQVFFLVKGIVGLIGTLGLLFHMKQSWPDFDRDPGTGRTKGVAQRLRFFTLLYGAVLITGASGDQIRNAVHVSTTNIGAFGFAILLLVTVLVSIAEAAQQRQDEANRV